MAGEIARIVDGDTVVLRATDAGEHTIRIVAIDAPEQGHPLYRASSEFLRIIALGQRARAEVSAIDRHGRKVARVTIDGWDVGLAQITSGLALHYLPYTDSQTPEELDRYRRAQSAARQAGLGIWSAGMQKPVWFEKIEADRRLAAAQRGSERRFEGRIVGNKRSRKYHLPGCPSYADVSEKNRIEFDSEEAAHAAGFTIAGNCSRDQMN